MSAYTDLDPRLYAAHAFQMLLVSLFNRAQYSKLDFSKAIRDLPSRAPSNAAQLRQLMTDFHGLSILQNVIDGVPPFQTGNTSLLHDTLDGLQRGANITQLPRRIQQDYYQGLQGLMSRFAQDLSVRPTAVLTRLAAILKNPPATSSDSTPPSLTAYLAAETTKPATQRSSRTPSTERSTEAAFLAHTPEKRTTFAPRPSSDKRPPFDQRPSADKSPASANRSRPSSQRSAASTDYQRRLSDAQEIDELRQMISVFQSKIDKRQNRIDHANPDHAETHRPGSSTKDYAYTAYSLAGDASSCGESEFGYAGRD